MINIAVTGASGRMGRAILAAALDYTRFRVVGATVRAASPHVGTDAGRLIERPNLGVTVTDDVATAFPSAAVIIDFTLPEGSLVHAAAAARAKIPIVIGTTGFTKAELQTLRKTTEHIAVVFSPNMSVGVNLFWYVATQLATRCGPDYQLAIDETHHVHKKDAPSGTAKRLHELVAHATGRDVSTIPVTSHREGEVAGDHTISFDSTGDCITITHHAKTRAIFAHGALVAAAWIVGKKPGWYSMNDVLGLK